MTTFGKAASVPRVGGSTRLYDPLTGLLAFPSFEDAFVTQYPDHAAGYVHLAIGDVDDLRGHVLRRHTQCPELYGHLAGNECMQATGRVTAAWASERVTAWPFGLCGTFGGDEVIIAAAGPPYEEFRDAIHELAEAVRVSAPCMMSFAVGTIPPCADPVPEGSRAFRSIIAHVDAALFDFKAERRATRAGAQGEVVDIGPLDVLPA